MALIVQYLAHLAVDAGACKQFKNDPKKAMTAYGLSADQQNAVLSGQAEILGAAMTNEIPCADIVASMTTKVNL